MSDKPLVLDVPEELLDRAQAGNLNVKRIVIDALSREVERLAARDRLLEIMDRDQTLSDEYNISEEEIMEEIRQIRRERHKSQGVATGK